PDSHITQGGTVYKIRVAAGAFGSLLAMSSAGWTAEPTGDGANNVVDEGIVTATRREKNLMEKHRAVSVLGGADSEERGIVSIAKLDTLVPNMKVVDQQNQGMGAVQISLRGIVNSSFIEIGDPNVGFHVDGVYMGRPQAALNLLFDA